MIQPIHVVYLVLVLQFLDALTTYIALKNPNNIEANAFMARVFKKFGVIPGLLITKVPFALLLWYFQTEVAIYALYAICVVYAVVVTNNIKLIRK